MIALNWSLVPNNVSPQAEERFALYDVVEYPSAVFGGFITLSGWECYVDNFDDAIEHSSGNQSIVDIMLDFTDEENLNVSADLEFSDSLPIDAKIIFALVAKNPQFSSWDYVVLDASEPILIESTIPGEVYEYSYQFDPADLIFDDFDILPENYEAVAIVQEWMSYKVLQSEKVEIGTVGNDSDTTIPSPIYLGQNYPNPVTFSGNRNSQTVIPFSLQNDSNVKIEIFNLKGQKLQTLKNEKFPEGKHTVKWNGKLKSGERIAAGIYFYRLTTDHSVSSKKMLILK